MIADLTADEVKFKRGKTCRSVLACDFRQHIRNKVDQFRRQPMDIQNVLMQLNIADDYFKAKKQISILEEDIESKEKEIYDLKHELIAAQMKMESTEKNMKGLQKELNENAKKIVRMETELRGQKKA